MVKNRFVFLMFFLVISMIFSSCASAITPVSSSGAEKSESNAANKNQLKTAAESLQSRVFIDASRSMIGFIDWEDSFESKYMGITRILLEELYDMAGTDNVSLFRFDLDVPIEYMKLGYSEFNAEKKRAAFYNYSKLNSIPEGIPRTNTGTEVVTAKNISGWFDERKNKQPDDILEKAIDSGMPNEPYKVAIEQFGKQDELNIIVTDLYGLHSADAKSQFNKLKTDYLRPGRAVGIFVYESEFSGMLPSYVQGVTTRFWGLPPTGYFTGSKDRSYWWPQNTTAKNRRFYQRFDIYGITMEERMAQLNEQNVKTRPGYVILAGMRDDVAALLERLEKSTTEYYHDLVYDSELFTVDKIDVPMDESDIEVVVTDNITQSDGMNFDIIKSASGSKPTITFTLPYTRNPMLDSRLMAAKDFVVLADVYVGNEKLEPSALPSVISLKDGKLVVSVDAGDLEKGKYRVDFKICLKPFDNEFNSLNKWNWQINAQDLYYLSTLNDEEWTETVQYNKTAGLSGLISMLGQAANGSSEPVELCDFKMSINKLQ